MRAAVWARVSTSDQHTENQLIDLRAWAAGQGLDIVAEYVTEDSAWSGSGAEFEAARDAMLAGVGEHPVILVWALDRLSRLGAEDMLRYLRLLGEAGADVRARQDGWLATADPFTREIMTAISGANARAESSRRSERIKLGLARRKAEGKPVGGRKLGARDRKPRDRSGQISRRARERAEQGR